MGEMDGVGCPGGRGCWVGSCRATDSNPDLAIMDV